MGMNKDETNLNAQRQAYKNVLLNSPCRLWLRRFCSTITHWLTTYLSVGMSARTLLRPSAESAR